MCLMSYANNKGADQPAHPRSLISTFVVHCLGSIISLDSIAEISRLWLASVAAQASLCLIWSETPEETFSHDEAHIHLELIRFPSVIGVVIIITVMVLRFQRDRFELPHDKTNKMTCVPREDSDQPGHLLSLISFHCLHEES